MITESANPSTVNFSRFSAGDITSEQLAACADLFSEHYGTWSLNDPGGKSGNVRRSAEQIRKVYLPDNHSWAAIATHDGETVAYAFVLQVKSEALGWVDWVTQLVVHQDFRDKGVAKRLLAAAWGFSDRGAWGLVTPNPFAIRALEKATRRRCDPQAIGRSLNHLIDIATEHVPYVAERSPTVEEAKSVIDTQFYVDHSQLDDMLASTEDRSGHWLLGRLEEGEEWFAFTFQDQDPFPIQSGELATMLSDADESVRHAYERMSLDRNHVWMKYGPEEVRFIIDRCGVGPSHSVVDFGCGQGRHAIEFATRGYRVTGVDFSEQFIRKARQDAQGKKLTNIDLVCDDCRTVSLDEQFDLGICLYDVIGSFADDIENEKILHNLNRHIKMGGRAVLSVMNIEIAKTKATRREDVMANPDCLLGLPASNIMETSGAIFDPEYFLLDEQQSLVYRKEQFAMDDRLPAEFIVRDRRYFKEEIEEICHDAGFEIDLARYVQLGKWESELDAQDDRAKEILVIATKVSELK